jgi:hypothetical protein
LPVTAYLDGSGTHGWPILTLAAVVVEDSLLDALSSEWTRALTAFGMPSLHMRLFHDLATKAPHRAEELRCAILSLLSRLGAGQGYLYARSRSVITADHATAATSMRLLKTPPELCVDFCLGGLTIPDADAGREDVVSLVFDRKEPFQRCVYNLWARNRRCRRQGWPRQVRAIQTGSSSDPGLQAADLIAWTVNRYFKMQRSAPSVYRRCRYGQTRVSHFRPPRSEGCTTVEVNIGDPMMAFDRVSSRWYRHPRQKGSRNSELRSPFRNSLTNAQQWMVRANQSTCALQKRLTLACVR